MQFVSSLLLWLHYNNIATSKSEDIIGAKNFIILDKENTNIILAESNKQAAQNNI